jgi:hypothetical protein
MSPRDLVYVGHVLDMARKAVDKVRDLPRDTYNADEDLRLALIHLVQVIGEAARQVSREFAATHPEIPWENIIGMRTRSCTTSGDRGSPEAHRGTRAAGPSRAFTGVCLPRRRCSHAHADRGLLPFGDNDERRLNLHGGLAQRVNHCEHERRRDVSRTQVDDPDKRRSGADGGTTEGHVMGDDHSPLIGCTFENIDIRPANQSFVPSRAQIAAARSKARDDVWSDVLV